MTWLQTATGKVFDFENPTPEMICPEDIVLALSRTTRFNGHVPFYSVAQHSLEVSFRFLDAERALIGLLHDAAEAYVGDVVSPLKRMPYMQGYRDLEGRVWAAIASRFELPEEIPEEIEHADLRMCATEKETFIPQEAKPWGLGVEPYASLKVPSPQPPAVIAKSFARRWAYLVPGAFNGCDMRRIWQAKC